MAASFDGDLRVPGNILLGGQLLPSRPRSSLELESLAEYPIALTLFRVWDAIQTNIPGTPASDDLGITGGTWATHAPKLTTGDVKASSATRRARVQKALPPEYDAGQTVTIRLSAGMETTIADGSATVDVEIFVNGRDGTIDGSDLVSTSATTINTIGFTNKDFVLDATSLSPGDELDIRITVATVDSSTMTAVIASIGAVELLADIRG